MNAFLPSLGLFLFVTLRLHCSVAEGLAVALSLYTFLLFVAGLGKTIALLACISFIAALEILLVPALTYWAFPASMPVESSAYFSYALPAYLAFYCGINGFNRQAPERAHLSYFQALTRDLQPKTNASIWLLVIGLVGFGVKSAVPAAPTFVGLMPSYCLFISAFYGYYSRSKYRFAVVSIAGMVLLLHTVWTGMFGDLFFWCMLTTIFLAAGMPELVTTRLKTTVVVVAFACLLLIQSIKAEYRYTTWGYQRTERSGDIGLMASLLTDRLTHPEKLLTIDHAFLSFARFNQGIMIGSAMAKVPMHEAYANGEVLFSLVYSLVPRLLWPGKPQTGGYENIRRFTSLTQSENTSINLSPLGEGYVNFGYGGILFALFYGLLLGGVFQYLLKLADRIPTLVLWLPMLYFGCLTMETDLLSTWGSLVNNAIFVFLLFWLFKRVGIQL